MSDFWRAFAGARRALGKSWWKLGSIIAGLLLIFVAWFLLPLQDWLQSFSNWSKGLGVFGYALFALTYVFAVIGLAPGSVFTLAAGVAFGLWAFPLVVVAATIGSCLAFLIARYVARDRVESALDKRPVFKAVAGAVKDEGWKIVGLMRLSPLVPFNLQNYFFGVTPVSFWEYALATVVGILPGTLLYVYLGSLGSMSAGETDASVLQWSLLGAGLLATVVVVWLVSKKAKAKLNELGVNKEENRAASGDDDKDWRGRRGPPMAEPSPNP
jgi:uncharacterized membrane protein YdjX (TVP38/TMEM64 family)